jgi:Flp pilus assembly protein TadD
LLDACASIPSAPVASPAAASFLSPPFAAALLFATHPVHTEAVTWVAGLPDLSFAFFFLLSFLLYLRSTDEKPPLPWSYPLSVLSFFLATLCKEPALTLPIVLMGYDSLVRRNPGGLLVRFRRYVPYFAAAGIYLILRFHALGGMAPSFRRHAYLSAWQYVVNAFPLFMQHLEKLLLPVNLNAFHVFHPISSFLDPKGIVALAVTIAFLLLAFLFLKRDRMIVFGLLWIVVPLLPVLYIPGLGDNTFAERYLYLPSFGFVLLASLMLPRLTKTGGSAAVTAFLLAALVGTYAAGTVARNRVWKDNYTLFTDTVKKSPDGSIPQNMLGTAFATTGRRAEAMRHYRIAVGLDPGNASVHSNIGYAYIESGDFRKAAEYLETAVRIEPFNALFRNNLAVAHFRLGELSLNAGRTDEAMEHFQAAARFRPEGADYRNMLGIAYGRKGRYDEAIEQFQAALQLSPEEPAYRRNFDRALGLKDRAGKAKSAPERWK